MVEYELIEEKDGRGLYRFWPERDKEREGTFIYDYETGNFECDDEMRKFPQEWYLSHAIYALREGRDREHGIAIWY
jgi:hypothetical protein